jgi:HD-GYP domain-containing protein (c-di-GMP phosphodiesterase class II)
VAEGLAITPEIKRTLRHRQDGIVSIHKADVPRLTLVDQELAMESGVAFDTETTQKLDEIVNRGFDELANGQPAHQALVIHGRRGYDDAQRQRLQSRHEKNMTLVGELMREALLGKSVDGSAVPAMIANYFVEMVQDEENVLTSVALSLRTSGLPTNPLAVSLLSMAIGVEMGLDADQVRDLGVCGLVHDWGMLRVPEEIRNATHRLSSGDYAEITKHPIYTLEMLEYVSAVPRVAPLVVYQVHERPNGQGYPRGRMGTNIHPFAKMVQVADMFTALRSSRPYRAPLMPYSAMECVIRQARDRHVEPEVVRALLRIQSLFPLGSFVTLSDGSVARVLRANRGDYTRPIVQRVQDMAGNVVDPHNEAHTIDLLQSELAIRQALPTPGSGEIALTDDAARS